MKSYAVVAFAAVMASAVAATCIEQRKAAEARVDAGMLGVQLPDCDEYGNWKALQCHPSAGMCRCVHPNGESLTEPSRHTESCVCFAHRDRQLKQGLLGALIPACEASGFYKRVQIHENQCFCLNVRTGERVGKSRNISELQDLTCE